MTEQERLQYIEDRKKQRVAERTGNRPRGSVPNSTKKKESNFAFRTYVTMVLTGGIFAISQFQSESAEMICSTIKSAIQDEMSQSQMESVKYYVDKVFANTNLEGITEFEFTKDNESIEKVENEDKVELSENSENSENNRENENDEKIEVFSNDTKATKIDNNDNEGVVYYPDIWSEP